MRRKAEFDAAFAGGKRIGNSMFGVIIHSSADDACTRTTPRLGLAIAAKAVGNAVARNRIRRTIRESFRLTQHALPAVDIVVSARPGARDVSRAALRASLEQLWQKVISQCA